MVFQINGMFPKLSWSIAVDTLNVDIISNLSSQLQRGQDGIRLGKSDSSCMVICVFIQRTRGRSHSDDALCESRAELVRHLRVCL